MEVLSFGWWFFMPKEWVNRNIFMSPLFFMGITFLINNFLNAKLHGKFQSFLNRYLIVTTAKILGLLILMGVYIYMFPEDSISFVITFFINYVVYSFFEARVLVLKNKEN